MQKPTDFETQEMHLKDQNKIQRMVFAITYSAENKREKDMRRIARNIQTEADDIMRWADPSVRVRKQHDRRQEEIRDKLKADSDKLAETQRHEDCLLKAHAQVAVDMHKRYPAYDYVPRKEFLAATVTFD
jgi:hypothetical protein